MIEKIGFFNKKSWVMINLWESKASIELSDFSFCKQYSKFCWRIFLISSTFDESILEEVSLNFTTAEALIN